VYASNCPISRPVSHNYTEDRDFDGMSWNNVHGLFFKADDELLPIKPPAFLSYKPVVGG